MRGPLIVTSFALFASAATACANPRETKCGGPIVSEAWVIRTARLESGFKPARVGDNGRSRGMYQIQRRAWEHYSKVRWVTGAHDPIESKRVARLILADCVRACQRSRKPVTFENARYVYRRGGF
jgi:hypothetical protein